jgi:hypothetical protein
MRLKIFAALLFFVFTLLPLDAAFGVDFNWAVHGSIFFFPADNGVDSDPSPIIPNAGFSLIWQFARFFKLEFSEDIYFTGYAFDFGRGYPMASNQENSRVFVLGFVTGIHVVGFFPIGDRGAAIRVFGGPAADLRVVTVAFGLNHPSDFLGDENDAQLQTDAVLKYFWENGRWFMPTAGLGFDFPLNEKFLLGFDFRTWFPVYKLWAEDNTSAIDGWRFGAGFRITVR